MASQEKSTDTSVDITGWSRLQGECHDQGERLTMKYRERAIACFKGLVTRDAIGSRLKHYVTRKFGNGIPKA
jgi:hypothetical protein